MFDLDDYVENINIMLKFADDTKLGHRSDSDEDINCLQIAINKLVEWADCWCMKFNVGKCKIMHIGRKNNQHVYTMAGQPLQVIDNEKDIGVIISNNMKPSLQCANASRRASAVLTQISRAFMYRDKNTFLQLYKQFVRCHLEFAIPAWSPWLVSDIEILERVQKRAVRMIVGLHGRTYEEKLIELGLKTLESRRKRYDLVQTFKIINGFDKVNSSIWFRMVDDQQTRLTRNTSYNKNLIATRFKTDIRRNFFSCRVVSLWNNLPIEVKESKSVISFKTKLENIDI